MDINAEYTCRACLNRTENGVSIFELFDQNDIKYCEMLSSCSGIEIATQDEYPHKLCPSCTFDLPSAWKFVKMCRASDELLHKYYVERKTDILEKLLDVKVEIKEEFSPSSVKSDNSNGNEDPDFEDDGSCKMEDDFEPLVKTGTLSAAKKKPGRKKKAQLSYIKCTLCDYFTVKECRLKKHIKKNHVELLDEINNYPCGICGKHFKRKSDRVVHLRVHSGEKPFLCNYCPMKFAQSGTLIEHERNHTGETPFVCKFCPRVFSSRSSFWRHKRVHTKEKPYSCKICGKSFTHSSTLSHHQLVHTDERPHVCNVCGKTTKSKYAMQQHMLIHSEKDFVCEQCGKKFSMKPNLINHIKKMHSDIAGCCVLCKKNTSNLAEHMVIHSGECHYQCHICNRKFRQKNSLSFHIALHNNAEKYKCTVDGCKKAFPRQNMLNFHNHKVHSNETPHVCEFCSRGFFRISDLSRHLNTVHHLENITSK